MTAVTTTHLVWFRYSRTCPWQLICGTNSESTAELYLANEKNRRSIPGWIKGEYRVTKWGEFPSDTTPTEQKIVELPDTRPFGFLHKGSGI